MKDLSTIPEDNRTNAPVSADRAAMHSVNNGSSKSVQFFERALSGNRYALLFYSVFMVAIYWPVFLKLRFFWEDFFIQEYPIREYSFYMIRFVHELPFWNPYSWPWASLLADAQSGFWYPTNLLQIGLTWLFYPHAQHLPVLVPEIMTLLHLPLAALGVFVLLKKEFKISAVAAFVAGLCWGFGVRMIAEQNHSMQIIQLALLPWETLVLMRSWNSWRHAIGFGVLFGISFFAGQPQTFFFFGIFFAAFTLAESFLRWRDKSGKPVFPIFYFFIATIVTVGISSIQLFPLLELIGRSARAHLSYRDASVGGLQLGQAINFFIPKFFGEYPGFGFPTTKMTFDSPAYWEGAFYWGLLAEILAVFAIVHRWKLRLKSHDIASRYLGFFIIFSIVAFGYGMGSNFIAQWPLWKFVPFFDHIRSPNRMVWLVWFLGTLFTGVALDDVRRSPNLFCEHRKYFYWVISIVGIVAIVSITGVFDLVFRPHIIRDGMRSMIAPSIIVAIVIVLFLIASLRRWISLKWIFPIAALLIAGDLLLFDSGWHRNTLDPEMAIGNDSLSVPVQSFRKQHTVDCSKLLVIYSEDTMKEHPPLGMFLRMPIEYAIDTNNLQRLNPLRLNRILPPITSVVRRLEIAGVGMVLKDSSVFQYPGRLPFLKLYRKWIVATGDSERRMLNDPSFDFSSTVLLSQLPKLGSDSANIGDSTILTEFSENHLNIVTHVSKPSVLVVNDLFDPNWEASIDGIRTSIMRAFESLRGIVVPAGSHVVELRYESSAFDWGWRVTMTTLALSFLTLWIARKQRTGRKQKDPAV